MKSPLPFQWPPNQQNLADRTRWSSALASVGNNRVPYPPQNVRITPGTLKLTVTWDAPAKDAQYVSGYRVFLDTESKLVREISDPNTRTADIAVSDTQNHNVFVASINATKKQSRPVRTYAAATKVDLDGQVADGSTYQRTTGNEKTGAGRAYGNIASDGTYGPANYHKSAVRQSVTTQRGGSTSGPHNQWFTVGSFTLHIPSGCSQFKGTLHVSISNGPMTSWTVYGKMSVGANDSNQISFSSPTASASGVVTITGLTGDTDITVGVKVKYTGLPGGDYPDSVGSLFDQISYTDQDASMIQ
jgi:hypothetical protein